jgi:signal transduction histidine kinase/ActR/RegA family two-component response regulator
MQASERPRGLGTANFAKMRWRLFAVIAALSIVAVVVSGLIVQRQATLDRTSRYNVTWLTSQAALEFLRLQEAIAVSALPGTELDIEEVALRFDIMRNRLVLLRSGEVAAFLADLPALAVHVDALDAALAIVEPALASPLTPERAARLRRALDPVVPKLLQLASASNSHSGEIVAHDQRSLSLMHWSLDALLFVVIFCCGALMLAIMRLHGYWVVALLHGKKVAEEANDMKSKFVANVSHDLRTPLTGVLGMLALVRERLKPGETLDLIKTAEQSAGHLLAIVNDVLDISMLEAGHLAIDNGPVDVRAIVASVVSTIGPAAAEGQSALTYTIGDQVPQLVEGDGNRISQILLNLLGNAVKFTRNGNVRLALDAVHALDGRKVLRFAVIDTGIGMSAATQARLFQHFVQADPTIRQRFGGTGLGLAISRQLARLMAGDVHVESQEGRGTTFHLEIPCRALAAPASRAAESVAAPTPSAVSARLRILAAEDVPTNQLLLRHLLARDGHEFEIVGNGVEAVQAVRRSHYDVVLMDVQMPELDGVQATQQIRHLREPGHDVPIIMLTANAMSGDRERFINAGANDYLAKPIRFEALREALANHARIRKAA